MSSSVVVVSGGSSKAAEVRRYEDGGVLSVLGRRNGVQASVHMTRSQLIMLARNILREYADE